MSARKHEEYDRMWFNIGKMIESSRGCIEDKAFINDDYNILWNWHFMESRGGGYWQFKNHSPFSIVSPHPFGSIFIHEPDDCVRHMYKLSIKHGTLANIPSDKFSFVIRQVASQIFFTELQSSKNQDFDSVLKHQKWRIQVRNYPVPYRETMDLNDIYEEIDKSDLKFTSPCNLSTLPLLKSKDSECLAKVSSDIKSSKIAVFDLVPAEATLYHCEQRCKMDDSVIPSIPRLPSKGEVEIFIELSCINSAEFINAPGITIRLTQSQIAGRDYLYHASLALLKTIEFSTILHSRKLDTRILYLQYFSRNYSTTLTLCVDVPTIDLCFPPLVQGTYGSL